MVDYSATIARVCTVISSHQLDRAGEIIRREYPFVPYENAGRKYTPFESLQVFLRDGFIDRYSGIRLVNPGVLRLLTALLPKDFPAHPNWKMSESHIGFWKLFPTIDHLVPVARGGADQFDNWVTTSMFRNSAKSNALLEELGWQLYPPETSGQWDGLTSWLISYCERDDGFSDLKKQASKHHTYIATWYRASKRVLAVTKGKEVKSFVD